MNQLPAEILGHIFLQLHHDQKAKCMRVCRSWARLIGQSYLFHTMRVSTDMSLLKLLHSVNCEREIGAQCERLVLNLSISESHYLSSIPVLFPRLRAACFQRCLAEHDLKVMENHPWTEHLEILIEMGSAMMIKQLLSSGKCPHLKTLVGTGFHDHSFSMLEMNELLVNAPALNTLVLNEYAFSTSDLDVLHSNLPCLKSFSLLDCELTNSELTPSIKPAVFVTKLVVKDLTVRSLEKEIDFLQYISRKYPNLQDFEYVRRHCYFQLPARALDYYRPGWLSIFTASKSQLRSLKIRNENTDLDFCGLLDQAGCQVQKLHLESLYESLFLTNQTNYIQTLVIETNNLSSYGCGWLKKLKLLKKLKWIISANRTDAFSLNELVDILPNSLESLSLKSSRRNTKFNFEEPTATTRLLSIQNVSLSDIQITADIESFLNKSIPNLNRLKLHQCKVEKPTISFPNTRFACLQISCDFQAMYRDVILSTMIDNKRRRYAAKCRSMMGSSFKHVFGTRDAPMYPGIEVTEFNYSGHKPYIQLVCYSVQDLIITEHF